MGIQNPHGTKFSAALGLRSSSDTFSHPLHGGYTPHQVRKFTIFTLFYLLTFEVFAQKEDNVWVFSYKYTFQTFTNGIYFDFEDSLKIQERIRQMSIGPTNASISDKKGKLLLYTNGCYMSNGEDEYIENSDELNPGYAYTYSCLDDSMGYSSNQAALLLPSPKDSNLIYLFHVSTFFQLNPLIAFDDKLYYSIVDVSANNSHGKVISKNNIIIDDTLHNDGLHAVRHANGRDWWVVIPKNKSNVYFIILFSANGISYHTQSIGPITQSDAGGELIFSPDGSKLARFNPQDDLRIFDFDRCNGLLSNPRYIPIVDNADSQLFGGLAFSADGHYLYAAEIRRLLQFDMWDIDIAATKKIVAESVTSPDCSLGSAIGYLELGPDGRIYCRPINGQKCMHRIAKPEKPASECDFVQFYYNFDQGYRNLPHFPNFRLGPIDGSSCDTLNLDNHPIADWRHDLKDSLSVDFTSLASFEPTSFFWEFGDPILGTSVNENPSFTFPSPGVYKVCLTVNNSYGYDTKCKTLWLLTTGTTDQLTNSKINIFPNPTRNKLRITGNSSDEYIVRVLNLLGQVEFQQIVKNDQISLDHLQSGFYLVQIIDAKNQLKLTKKIQILK